MSDNMHGFKAYEPGLICRGHKYEENTVYKKSGHGICVPGVTHYCVNPFDVLDHYPLVRPDGQFSDFTTVEAIDPPVTDDDKKFATSAIKIGVKRYTTDIIVDRHEFCESKRSSESGGAAPEQGFSEIPESEDDGQLPF